MALLNVPDTPLRALAVLACLGAACDLVRPDDPLALDGSVVATQTVLFAGDSVPEVIVYYPQGNQERRPSADVWLGPGFPAPAERMGPQACTFAYPTSASCYGSALSRPVEEGATYSLRVLTPGDTTEGRTRVPRAPTIEAPLGDTTIRLPVGGSAAAFVLRFSASPDAARTAFGVRSVVVEYLDGSIRTDCGLLTQPSNSEWIVEPSPVTVRLDWVTDCPSTGWSRIRAGVSLVAYDSAYVRFLSNEDAGVIRRPWPDFGLTRGIGLFASAARSREIHVTVER